MSENLCVMCGAAIPEGRQCCPGCGMTEGSVFEQLMKNKGVQFEVDDRIEQAYRQGFEAGVAQIEEKHLSECRQISEYDRELREAKRLLGEMLEVMNDSSCAKSCASCMYIIGGCNYGQPYKWKHTDEVVKLIGGEKNEN